MTVDRYPYALPYLYERPSFDEVCDVLKHLREKLPAYHFVRKEELIRAIAVEFRWSYKHAKEVFLELAEMNEIEWEYGNVRLARNGSLSR